jgi:hypothetical protein
VCRFVYALYHDQKNPGSSATGSQVASTTAYERDVAYALSLYSAYSRTCHFCASSVQWDIGYYVGIMRNSDVLLGAMKRFRASVSASAEARTRAEGTVAGRARHIAMLRSIRADQEEDRTWRQVLLAADLDPSLPDTHTSRQAEMLLAEAGVPWHGAA